MRLLLLIVVSFSTLFVHLCAILPIIVIVMDVGWKVGKCLRLDEEKQKKNISIKRLKNKKTNKVKCSLQGEDLLVVINARHFEGKITRIGKGIYFLFFLPVLGIFLYIILLFFPFGPKSFWERNHNERWHFGEVWEGMRGGVKSIDKKCFLVQRASPFCSSLTQA